MCVGFPGMRGRKHWAARDAEEEFFGIHTRCKSASGVCGASCPSRPNTAVHRARHSTWVAAPQQRSIRRWRGGAGTQNFVHQKWSDQIFPILNFIVSHDGHFGLGEEGAGGGGVPLLLRCTAIPILPWPAVSPRRCRPAWPRSAGPRLARSTPTRPASWGTESAARTADR